MKILFPKQVSAGPSNPTLGHVPEGSENVRLHGNVYAGVTAASFATTEGENCSNVYPPVNGEIKYSVFTQQGIFGQCIKRNKLVVDTWVGLENRMLSERSRRRRPHMGWFHSREVPRTGKQRGTGNKLQLLGGGAGQRSVGKNRTDFSLGWCTCSGIKW